MVKVQEYNLSTGHTETLKSFPDDEYGIATMFAETAGYRDTDHVTYVDIEDTEDECGI